MTSGFRRRTLTADFRCLGCGAVSLSVVFAGPPFPKWRCGCGSIVTAWDLTDCGDYSLRVVAPSWK